MRRVVFITATDTGIGKTVLTSLLLAHLRSQGLPAQALKPFCSGPRTDVQILRALQDNQLSLNEINAFHFPEPLAPLVAARKHRRKITLDQAVSSILEVARRIDSSIQPPPLLIEGAGGLLAPLGEGFTALDLIQRLSAEVLVVARNQLGVINHALLTVRALTQSKVARPRLTVVLMSSRAPDSSAASNVGILTELLAPIPLFCLPYLGRNVRRPPALRAHAKLMKSLLAKIIA